MNTTNICWECKHGTMKLKILIPYNATIKEYLDKTIDLQSQIVAISQKEKGQYNVWFRSEGKLRLLCFKMLHVCKLKLGQEKIDKVGACENYDLSTVKTSSVKSFIARHPCQNQQKLSVQRAKKYARSFIQENKKKELKD